MTSSADVFVRYGIFVSTRSLLATSLAYPKLVDPLRALALIHLRRRQGALRSSSTAIEAVPDEVRELVQNALVKIEQDDAEYELFMELQCDTCQWEADRNAHTSEWADLWDTDCENCAELRWAYEGLSQKEAKAQTAMLAHYGLEHPIDKCSPRSREVDSVPFLTDHPDSGTLIAIRQAEASSRTDAVAGRATAAVDFDEPGSEHRRDAISDLSLQLPAERRGRALPTIHPRDAARPRRHCGRASARSIAQVAADEDFCRGLLA